MVADEILRELRGKIKKMITLLQRYTTENKALREELKKKEEEINIKKRELEALETKFETLKLAKSISGIGTGNDGARDKINVIIRDLDRCIGLLNR
ncbi:MAG: hypothetical protein J7K46_08680 [Bacteroidales bacterium]|nr:hypothetical protein [Bacteroidales bacterium]